MLPKTRQICRMPVLAASTALFLSGCGTGADEPTGSRSLPATGAPALEEAAAPDALSPSYPGGFCGPRRRIDLDVLEFIPVELLDDILIQHLPRPTPLGEEIAVHVRVPPTPSPELDRSLLRVAGDREAPVLLFNSDALAQIGHLEKSPGRGFFTAFAGSDKEGIDLRLKLEEEVAGDKVNETALVFDGRHVVAKTHPNRFDAKVLGSGEMLGLGAARFIPISNATNWGESVFITDPEVVADPTRTRDTCTDEGDACGPWTFCHLMTEMANTPMTGISPSTFTRQWLQQWLSDYTVNGDSVPRRTAMWNTVIAPWLAASGGQQLDLRKAPFRLLAIVNRLDLRRTGTGGGSGYGGGGGEVPLNAGELRFVFGVMRPDSTGRACTPLPFTVIFEYGVPIGGCVGVREWAKRWTALDAMGGFGPAYLAALESITEDVVTSNANPGNGNGSALNQIRTNENALAQPWELREFTLKHQTFFCDHADDSPASGFLRPHTVAQTPDDDVHTPTANPLVDEYVNEEVVPPASSCETSYTVPPRFDCGEEAEPFLGANAFASLVPGGAPPGAWLANPSGAATNDFICGRHQFSFNTCSGCHTCDTHTLFTHVDPLGPLPAALSGFLTGAVVPDTQFSGVLWTFHDLDRRYQDLYDVAGSLCLPFLPPPAEIFDIFEIDPIGPIVIDLKQFEEIFQARLELGGGQAIQPILDDFAAPQENISH